MVNHNTFPIVYCFSPMILVLSNISSPGPVAIQFWTFNTIVVLIFRIAWWRWICAKGITNLAIACTLDVITWQSSISAVSTSSIGRGITLISLSKCCYKISLHGAHIDTLWWRATISRGRSRGRGRMGERDGWREREKGEGAREIAILVLAVLHYSCPSPSDRRHSPCCLHWWEYWWCPC